VRHKVAGSPGYFWASGVEMIGRVNLNMVYLDGFKHGLRRIRR
jgi:hypothetical protein